LLKLSKAIFTLYAVGVSKEHLSVLRGGLWDLLFSSEYLPFDRGHCRKGQGLAGRAPGRRDHAVFLNGTFLSIRRGKTAKELVYNP